MHWVGHDRSHAWQWLHSSRIGRFGYPVVLGERVVGEERGQHRVAAHAVDEDEAVARVASETAAGSQHLERDLLRDVHDPSFGVLTISLWTTLFSLGRVVVVFVVLVGQQHAVRDPVQPERRVHVLRERGHDDDRLGRGEVARHLELQRADRVLIELAGAVPGVAARGVQVRLHRRESAHRHRLEPVGGNLRGIDHSASAERRAAATAPLEGLRGRVRRRAVRWKSSRRVHRRGWAAVEVSSGVRSIALTENSLRRMVLVGPCCETDARRPVSGPRDTGGSVRCHWTSTGTAKSSGPCKMCVKFVSLTGSRCHSTNL